MPIEMFGRERELERVQALLRHRGGYEAIVVLGEPGIGKTTILGEAARIAEGLGALVLGSSAVKSEATLSFATLADLLERSDPSRLAQLPEPQRRALEVALLRSQPDGRPPDPRAIGTGLLSLLRAEAVERPVVVHIDDVHWIDRASADALQFAVRRLRDERVRVIATLRRGDETALSRTLCEGPSRMLELGGLPLATLARIIRSNLGIAPPQPLLVQIEETSKGNPYYAIELARALAAGGDTSAAPGAASRGLAELARERLSRLPDPTRAELLAAAVLQTPLTSMFDASLLVPAEAEGLVRVGADGRLEFAHPILAASVRAGASSTQLRSAHRRAATLVVAPEERARHLALAATGPDARIAALLDEAANAARAQGATAAAADLALQALRMTPPDSSPSVASRRFSVARYLVDAGDLPAADQQLARLRDCEDRHLRSCSLQLQAMVESRTAGFSRARATALEALSIADKATRAVVEVDVAFYEVSLGDFRAALPHARLAVELTAVGATAGLREAAIGVCAMVEFLTGSGARRLEIDAARSRNAGAPRPQLVARPQFVSNLLLLWTDQPARAREGLLDLERELAEAGEEASLPLVAFHLVWSEVCLGRIDDAAQRARVAAETAALGEDRMNHALALTALALVHACTSGLDRARPAGLEALSLCESIDWRLGAVLARWALGLAALADGRVEQVHATLGSLAESVLGMGFADPIGCIFVPDEVEALAALGAHAEAARLVELLESRGLALDRASARAAASRCAGILAAATGDEDVARQAFERALEQHRRAQMPFDEARTVLAAGMAMRRFKRRREARSALERAGAMFAAIGARRWQERCLSEMARLGTRPGSDALLSGTERRVAELAAADLSNREIADLAFLSVKAVEANLTRAYRKLGVRSRAGLGAALRSDGSCPPPSPEPEAAP